MCFDNYCIRSNATAILHLTSCLYVILLRCLHCCSKHVCEFARHCLFSHRLGATCNHVAALLFKLDYAWTNGLMDACRKPCTSNANQWLAPALTAVVPVRAADMLLKKPKYANQSTAVERRHTARKLFTPYRNKKDSISLSLEEITHCLYPECPTAVIFNYSLPYSTANYQPESDVNVVAEELCSYKDSDPPPSFHQYAKQFKTPVDLLNNLPVYTSEQLQLIESSTRQQACSNDWFEQKRGRITASIAHSVYTRSKNKRNSDTSATIVDAIMGTSKKCLDNVPAIRHSRDVEPVAAVAYEKYQKQHHHDLVVTQCGLFVDPSTTHLAASPDRLVQCSCCGEGLLEIKCPYACQNEDPNEANIAYLFDVNGRRMLRQSHAYYTQIQMQMAATSRMWCDLFVYCKRGHFLQRIAFDKVYWEYVEEHCEQFFVNFVAPRLIRQ